MGKFDGLILKIVLGIFAATNFVTCIITTDFRVLITLNFLLAVICFGFFLFVGSVVSGLSRDFAISRKDARKLVGEYFSYYKNIERISIDEYLERSLNVGNNGGNK